MTEHAFQGCNRENMRLWVDALRSGDFRQTTGKLSNGREYCCLGVACEVAMANGAPVVKKELDLNTVSYNKIEGSLPGEVAKWLGLATNCPKADCGCEYPEGTVRVKWNGEERSVISLNDSEGLNFRAIADCLEEEFLRD